MKRPATLLLLLFGCAPPAPPIVGGDVFLPPSHGIGERSSAVTVGDGPNGAHIIFLNFDGATVSPPSAGADNAATNESMIARSTATLPAFDASAYAPAFTRAAAMNAITNYFKGYYADFNVQVVTTRPPANVRYTMCIIGGNPGLVGIGGSAAGVAPLDCGNQNEPDVTYAFSEVLDPSSTGSATESLKAIAVTAAQETAHSYELGHTTNQRDIMYPQLTFQAAGFAMGPQQLQNDGSGACIAGATQDSWNTLKEILGPSSGPPPPTLTPQVAFVSPADGATVPLTFTIEVSATEPSGSISRVDVTSGPNTLFSAASAPYQKTITAPQAGTFQLTATAYDPSGGFASTSIHITVSASAPPQPTGCTKDADCNSGLVCMSQKCVMPAGTPAPGTLGAACKASGDCNSGLCANTGGDHSFCTAACNPQDSSTCPSTMDCMASGSEHYCTPKNGNRGGGGCAVSGGAPSGMLAPLCLLLALSLFRRRRAAA